MTIFAIVTVIFHSFALDEGKTARSIGWGLVLFSLASIVAISRVAVGAHWPFDLLLGAALGYFGGLSGVALTLKYPIWWRWMAEPNAKRVHALALSVVAIVMIAKYYSLPVAWLALGVAGSVTMKLLAPGESNGPHR